MATENAVKSGERVSKADITAKLGQIQDQVTAGTEAAKPKLASVAAGAAIATAMVAYLLGRRRGRRRSTVVEIRRV